MHSNLVKHAVDSITVAVEDFEANEEKRSYSAVRNLFSGVMLLVKAVIVNHSPSHLGEVLIYADIKPIIDPVTKASGFVARGKETVDVAQALDRIKMLGRTIDVAALKAAQKIRNEIEHYVPSKGAHAIARDAIATSFTLINDLLETELGLKATDQFSPEIWDVMLAQQALGDKVRKLCSDRRKAITNVPPRGLKVLKETVCPNCGSELLAPDDRENWAQDMGLECKACGERTTLTNVLPEAVYAVYGNDYEVGTQGEEPNVYQCPNCHEHTFLSANNMCLLCGDGLSYTECNMCGEDLGPEDQDNDGMCSYHANAMSKDD